MNGDFFAYFQAGSVGRKRRIGRAAHDDGFVIAGRRREAPHARRYITIQSHLPKKYNIEPIISKHAIYLVNYTDPPSNYKRGEEGGGGA